MTNDDRGGGGDHDDRPRGGRGGGGRGGGGGGFRARRRLPLMDSVDYKDVGMLRRFVTDRGKIDQRRKIGASPKNQRMIAQAIKRARHMALLPYTAEHIRQSGISVGYRGGGGR